MPLTLYVFIHHLIVLFQLILIQTQGPCLLLLWVLSICLEVISKESALSATSFAATGWLCVRSAILAEFRSDKGGKICPMVSILKVPLPLLLQEAYRKLALKLGLLHPQALPGVIQVLQGLTLLLLGLLLES